MAKRQEDAPPPGSPAWMATFSDLMNLLLCFFVMLFAMSTIEPAKLDQFVSAMNSTFSFFQGGASAIGDGMLVSNGVSQLNELDQYINSTGKTADSETDGDDFQDFELSPQAQETLQQYLDEERLQKNEETAEKIEEILQENRIGDEVDVSFTAQYIKLTMNGALLFDSASAKLKVEAEDVLDKVSVILERYSSETIEIVGHTDNVPMASGHKYADNEELSSARARSVFYYLEEHSLLNPASMKHSGMGDREPVADNSTPEGRSLNRRVEIRIFTSPKN